jgi:AraC-like DNA-binding protein
MSRNRCTKIFTQVYGISPRQYVSELKLKQAKELLVLTDVTVEEIARRLGFSSVHHFSRQFHRWTGKPPSHFRPKHTASPLV